MSAWTMSAPSAHHLVLRKQAGHTCGTRLKCLATADRCAFNDLETYKQRVRDIFDRRSSFYDLDNEYHPVFAKRLVEMADLQKGMAVLDIGTGTGLIALAAAERVGPAGSVLGLDISPGMVQKAQTKQLERGLENLEVRLADMEDITLDDNAYDVILCGTTISYVVDLLPALTRWRGWLKPGGKLLFNGFGSPFLDDVKLFYDMMEEKSELRIGDPHDRLGNPKKIENVMEECGFTSWEVAEAAVGYVLRVSSQEEYAERIWSLCYDSTWFPVRGLISETLAQELHDQYVRMVASRDDPGWRPGVGMTRSVTTYYVTGWK